MIYNESGLVTDELLDKIAVIGILKEKLDFFLKDIDFYNMKTNIQHGSTNCVLHSIAVTHFSLIVAIKLHLKVNYIDITTGALLHDYFLYDWHDKEKCQKWHGFKHPVIALKNATNKWNLNDVEKDIITTHMFPLTLSKMPKYKESVLVCIIDKICALYETFARKDPYKMLKKIYNNA